MIAATPTGTRKVKSCLSGISDGTVCPYRRRPSPRKKSQVSTISWTSPSASGYGLPISWVTSRASASLLASTSRPTLAITRPRAGAGSVLPLALGGTGGASGVDERPGVAERDLGDELVGVGGVGGALGPGGRFLAP